ncbi:Ig-like domain-containing protein [Balneicella halophila]|uniref:Ig-like domain-containing protein n=1 Tax=Balneicella halophila TaxID=1537566 RepID=A0A7L4UT37_BALHA|nr:Ig-like domain-containing protein [Balneicella halophila]PVX52214.1 Ig-like domain-containing protein [Balneicella halophila]
MRKYQIIIFFTFLLLSCANPGIPTGGEKDEEPPRITRTYPENYTLYFDRNKIVIDFNEFVKLENASQNVMISPPQKKKPKLRLKEKQIVVDLRDTLRENTTYTLDFGKAIVDNNEGNPLGEYRYVFSTGDQIDRMGIAGYVKGAQVDTVAQSATVALYIPTDTLNPFQKLPDYIAQTDTLGFFMFNNIVDREYKIIAFQDENSNSMLDYDEPIAFLKENVHTSETDRGDQDSLQLDKYTLFKNISLQLRMYTPVKSLQYLEDYTRPLPEQLNFLFNAPLKDSLSIEILNSSKDVPFYTESNETNDSLIYWIADKDIAQKDTLLAKLSYLKTDTLGYLSPYDDTLKLVYKEPKKSKKEQKEEEEGANIEFMDIQTNMSGQINYFDPLILTFERPVTTLNQEHVALFTKKDTISSPIELTLTPDSILPHRKYHVIFQIEPNEEYTIRIDSMAVYDSGGRPNKKLENSFSTYDNSFYGKLFVMIAGGEENVLIQLVKKSNPNVVIAQQNWTEGEVITFENLPPATYQLKALWDTNGNGKWDVGDYETQRQPERTKIFSKEIELRSNWELEVDWNLNN